MKKFHAVCALVWAIVTTLSAQQDARVVKFRLLCYEHSKDTVKGLVTGENGNQEISFFTGGFGPQSSGKFIGGKAVFFVENPGPDGKPVKKIVAQGDLVSSAVQMFLLFPETKEGGPVYKILAFDDLETSFPMGATRVINLASFPIRLNLSGADLPSIKPGGLQVYPQVKQVDEWNMYSARIDFEVAEGQWVPVATQSWKASNRKRDWVITHFDAATRSPAIRLYQDIPPWREDKIEPGVSRNGVATP